jgi:hypothetical protein
VCERVCAMMENRVLAGFKTARYFGQCKLEV